MTEPNGSGVGLSLRELVLEVREDVRAIKESAASKEIVDDHENRIRTVEKKIYIVSAGAIAAGGVLGKIVQTLGF